MRLANAGADTPDGVGTLLVSRRPFTDAELDTLEREVAAAASSRSCSARALPPTRRSTRLTAAGGLDDVSRRAIPINITAPTDDSPFFFNMLRLRDIVRTSTARPRQA